MYLRRNKHIDGISKLNYILTHHVTDFMNASRNFIVRNTWGYKNETTNMYDGLVGDLQSGRAEFAGKLITRAKLIPCFHIFAN